MTGITTRVSGSIGFFGLWIILASIPASAFAAQIPECMASGKPLPANNDQLVGWKKTTPNQFRDRGHVTGVVIEPLPDQGDHYHFIARIGNDADSTVEIIYNKEFGLIPRIAVGMKVEACGDFIMATAPSGGYPASPAGAILHWVHVNPSGKGHDSGYLALDGVLHGQQGKR